MFGEEYSIVTYQGKSRTHEEGRGGRVLNQEKSLRFNLSGAELSEEKYNLYLLLQGLSLSQNLLEQAYLVVKSKAKMTKNERDNFKIYINDIREGSFESDVIIMMQQISGPLLTGISGLNPKDIWTLASNSIKYLLAIFSADKKGEKINVNIDNSPNVSVNINSDGNTTNITTTREIIECAEKIEPTLNKSLNMIDEEKGVSSFNLDDQEDNAKSIHLGIKEKDIFDNRPTLEDEIVEFEGQITQANFDYMTGKIKVTDSKQSSLKKDIYSFSFVDGNEIEDVFRESCSRLVTVKAIKKVFFNTSKLEKDVDSIKIVKIV